ncbi:MAG: 5-formyltetrahydrofolate cyclo-ligase, partial [Desulfobulbia bacterium]
PKKSVRSEWIKRLATGTPPPHWGKVAEKLRGLQSYRDTATVFATPHESLLQARINCLVDGKNLLIPGPSIREGFFLLAARSIPYKNLSVAVTYKGLEKYGQRLQGDNISGLSVALLLTDSLAVDGTGGRIGDGYGYFDLCCALLQEIDAIEHDAEILTFIQEDQISQDMLPQEQWDIKMSSAITPKQIFQFEPSGQMPQIFWEVLPQDKIKRIDPLWKLYSKAQG